MPKKKIEMFCSIHHETLDKIKFGSKIGYLMAEKGFTNESFSEATGISVTTIKEIKYGRRLPSLQKYLWIIETLGVSDILPLYDFISNDCIDMAKYNILKNSLYPIIETMSISQIEELIKGIECFLKATGYMDTLSIQHRKEK